MRIRFDTARDVFENFPTLASDVVAGPSDEEPFAYLRRLSASETPEDALTFFAYFAPKREAVFWSCRCIRQLGVALAAAPALAAAERWVEAPEEEERRAALALAEASPSEAPETWAAYGAGWAGGNIAADGEPPVLAAAHLTAKAVRAAVLIAVAHGPPRQRGDRIAACVAGAEAVAGANRQ